ncbi:MAG: phospholipase/lecithinase/hemolysin [Planctomycetota bacterium]|nr:phospholipase/lecithinase/hemolysin [Planctomycetota bacterium]
MSILTLRGIESEIAPEAVRTGREDGAQSARPGILRAAEDRGLAMIRRMTRSRSSTGLVRASDRSRFAPAVKKAWPLMDLGLSESLMISKEKTSVGLASTALLILRNRISERVWGSHGVYTMPVEDPQPHRVGPTPVPSSDPSTRRKCRTIIHRGAHPIHSHSMPRLGSIQGIGILGDSISDEYRFYAPDRVTARNWVEILAATRGVFFGDPLSASHASRDRRFAYNWSQSGATTSSLIAAGQHASLAAQVSRGAAINLVAVTIGTNDFADALIKSKSVSAMGDVLMRAWSNLVAILDSMFQVDSGLKVAAFTAVDLRSTPLLRGAIQSGLISPAMADVYEGSVSKFNDRMRDLIAAHGDRAVLVDIDDLLRGIVEARRYLVGNREINRNVASNEADHLFLSDGFHPGTLGQCLIANRFLDAIDARFGAGISPLADEEMIRVATSVPKLSGFSLLGTGALALLGYGRRRPGVVL